MYVKLLTHFKIIFFLYSDQKSLLSKFKTEPTRRPLAEVQNDTTFLQYPTFHHPNAHRHHYNDHAEVYLTCVQILVRDIPLRHFLSSSWRTLKHLPLPILLICQALQASTQ